MMTWRAATPDDVARVVMNMRAESAAEAFASVPHDDRAQLAAGIGAALPHVFMLALCGAGGGAVALLGVAEEAPGRANIMFIATDWFPAIALDVHRWWLREFRPNVLGKFRRVEFTGSRKDTPPGRWLASLGFVCEGHARAYGKRGEDFGQWAWVNPCWRLTVDAAAGRLGSAGMHPARGGASV